MQAMIFAAGMGTRLQAETADKPKALVKIGRKTLLENAIEKLKSEGIEKIVVNVHHFADLIKSYLKQNDFGIEIIISDESSKLLDTGGGLKFAQNCFNTNEPIIIYNTDIISNLPLKNVLQFHSDKKALATLVVRKRQTQRYLKFDTDKKLVGWLNKKNGKTKIAVPDKFETAAEMAFSGIHIVQPEIFKMMPDMEKFSIIDVYLDLAKTNRIFGFFDDSELWMDVGKPIELEAARRIFNQDF